MFLDVSSQEKWDCNLEGLKDEHEKIYELIGSSKVAYLDYPVHFNVGDLLIYLGTEKFFENYDVEVGYRADIYNLNYKKISRCDVILFHGGGNFGDLYPQIHKKRESIITQFKNKRIICLPQTIHFKNEKNLQNSSVIFSNHNDFHFFVRDEVSKKLAADFTSKSYLCPDMAHSLHPLVDKFETGPTNNTPKHILNLVRKDIEKVKSTNQLNKFEFDWDDIIKFDNILAIKCYRLGNKLNFNQEKLASFWYRECRSIVFGAINFFRTYDVVYTDRLHGLILATLIGKEVKLKDNSYGKNSNYYNKWLKKSPYIEVVK